MDLSKLSQSEKEILSSLFKKRLIEIDNNDEFHLFEEKQLLTKLLKA